MKIGQRRQSCLHPYFEVKDVGWHDTCFDCGNEEPYFSYCTRCNTIVDVWDGDMPKKIPWDWPEDVKKKAQELTGKEIETPPKTAKQPVFSTLGDVLNRYFTDVVTDVDLSPPIIEQLRGKKR